MEWLKHLTQVQDGRFVIVVHYGEIGLKGENRPDFIRLLGHNLRSRLLCIGFDCSVRETPGMLVIEPPNGTNLQSLSKAAIAVSEVFGVSWFTPAIQLKHRGFDGAEQQEDLQRVIKALTQIAKRCYKQGASFAVRVRRGDKRLPFTSVEMERLLGAEILKNTPWEKVNLTNPDQTFYVDFRQRELFIYTNRCYGPGGLPVGSSGRALLLFSGGIDSPVAGWLAARRGCYLDLLHFSATSLTEDALRSTKIYRLAAIIAKYTLGVRLHVAPYTHFDLALLRRPTPHSLILFRRFMLRVAEKLASNIDAQVIVTGDNLAQVASQTLSNLISADLAVRIPVFRPLIGFDKNEIISLAKAIETYTLSIEPYKDCCALISRHPQTRSNPELIAQIERSLLPDYELLIERTLRDMITVWCTPDDQMYGDSDAKLAGGRVQASLLNQWGQCR